MALSKGCHFFLCFALCVAPRTCACKKGIDQLLIIDTSEYRFTLKRETVALFRNWAEQDQYANNPTYANFIESLLSGSLEYVAEDLATVKRLVLQRALDETLEEVVMNILFPDCMSPDNAHFEEQD
jgi:hypothetical protein